MSDQIDELNARIDGIQENLTHAQKRIDRHNELMRWQDTCLIAMSEGRRPPRHAIVALPPWRAVLVARIANQAGFMSDKELANLVAEAREVTGNGVIVNWDYDGFEVKR